MLCEISVVHQCWSWLESLYQDWLNQSSEEFPGLEQKCSPPFPPLYLPKPIFPLLHPLLSAEQWLWDQTVHYLLFEIGRKCEKNIIAATVRSVINLKKYKKCNITEKSIHWLLSELSWSDLVSCGVSLCKAEHWMNNRSLLVFITELCQLICYLLYMLKAPLCVH